ncbi:MAG TPA: cell division protein FtsA [bacterium]|nr:cell division protein FtsA [bacterium]
MGRKRENVVGLDIGTTKIAAIVGEYGDDGQINIVGIGSHPSRGLRKGVVVNIESTVESVRRAVEEAELMAGIKIHSAYVGIAGGHIRGFNSHGIIAIKTKEVTPADIDRVVDAAKAIAIPLDREVIHVLPQEYIVDDQDGIRDPLGMSGVRLEGKVHIVTAAVTSAQNVVKSVNRAGLEVEDIALEQLASSEAVLTPDEKELGVCLVDIGGGTSDLAIFAQGCIRHTAVLSLGGNHVTNDIAVGLRTPTHEAEKIKKKYGCALRELVKEQETIEVPSVGGREPRVLSRQLLSEIIEPRMEEIFTLIQREIITSGFADLISSGVVLTGGATIMDGVPELAERVMHLPVRRGIPAGVGGLVDVVSSPLYATGVGLLFYGRRCQLQGRNRQLNGHNKFDKVLSRMKTWFGDFF